MTLQDSILRLAEAHIDELNNWYKWRAINTKYLPKGITLEGTNEYKQNVHLKKRLNEDWHKTDDEQRKVDLTRYYIHHWGGVKTNKQDKIRSYSLNSPNELIALGKDGIASWSKALCIRNPDEYAIFDARVSIALNLLQSLETTAQRRLFPILSSRNKLVIEAGKIISKQAKEEKWFVVPENEFYQEYLDLLRKTGESNDIKLYTLEMLLFSKAPSLCERHLSQ